MSSSKTLAADRSKGGPGKSHRDAKHPEPAERHGPAPGEPTNTDRSRISGGGGEQDRHHTHDPRLKK